jgi:RNA polymerase sigma-70 factor (ECF subfamily)
MFTIDKIDTKELVIELQKKRASAFSVLYDNYAPALLGIAYKIVKDKTIAEEILQDVFVKIWKHIDTYDASKGTLFTWMLNITQNTCKDYFRSKQYKYQRLIDESAVENVGGNHIPHTTNIPENNIDYQILMQKIEPKYKDIIDLVYIYGYSQEQVAEKLKVPLGTVKTRTRAALKQLRNYFM